MSIKRVVATLLECEDCGDIVAVIPISTAVDEAERLLARADQHACVVLQGRDL